MYAGSAASGDATSRATRWPSPGQLLVALAYDDRGQDLIEYALLTAAVGVAGVASWPIIASTIGTAYRALNVNTQGLWVPPPPGGGS